MDTAPSQNPQYEQSASMSAAQGAKKAAGDFAMHTFGRNPKATGVVFIALMILLLFFIILFIVYLNRYQECENGGKGSFLGSSPLGNLNTGGNNPLWQKQFGDAGWGGPLHSTYQPGESRVWGASAEGGHSMVVAPTANSTTCGGSGAVSSTAMGEARALMAAQAFSPPTSAKNMSDDALMGVMMNGGV